MDNHDFVTKAISDMLEAGAASALPYGVRPTVSLLGWLYYTGIRLSFIIGEDMRRAGLSINWDKIDWTPLQ